MAAASLIRCSLALPLGDFSGGIRLDPSRGGAAYIGHDSVILGEEERVGLSTGKYEESTEVLAKIDTGARYSSIDRALAKKRGADLKNPEDRVEIEFSFGDKVRPLVRVRIKVAEKTLNTLVTVADRDELSKNMLLSSRNLEGFMVKLGQEQLTSPYDPRVESRTAALLKFPPPPSSAPTLLATLPTVHNDTSSTTIPVYVLLWANNQGRPPLSDKLTFLGIVCTKNGGFRYTPTPLRNACAFSHLYPPPPHVVAGLIATTSPEDRFTSRLSCFYSRF